MSLDAFQSTSFPDNEPNWEAQYPLVNLEPLTSLAEMRIALVHEWLDNRAGSEKVFEALAQLFPEADLFALTMNPDIKLNVTRQIQTTFLDSWSVLRQNRAATLPLMPIAWKTFTGEYDVVISSSHAFARYFGPAQSAHHLSYVHTPARYLWTPKRDSRGKGMAARVLAPALKACDKRSLNWTESLAANSTAVAHRIQRFYERDSTIIPPPVEVRRFHGASDSGNTRENLLCLGRWIPYKRVDLAIRAAHLAQEALTVAGYGPMESELRRLARQLGAPVKFEVAPSDAQVELLMASHRALLFPGIEDFGIVPVEASAAGLPTIAVRAGGALDTVKAGTNGWHVRHQTASAMAAAIARSRHEPMSAAACKSWAARFDADHFRKRIDRWVRESIRESKSRGTRG